MIKELIAMAVSCVIVGTILTFILLGVTARQGIDLNDNLWILAIPAVFAFLLNIALLELYRKFWKKK